MKTKKAQIPENTTTQQKLTKIPTKNIQQDPVVPIQGETDKQITTPTDQQQTNVEAPVVTTFSVENLKLKTALTPKLKGVTFENTINTINGIKDPEVKKEIQDDLMMDAIVLAQEYMGMYRRSNYSDNKADGFISSRMLNRMRAPWFMQKGENLIPFLSGDIKNTYRKFSDKRIDNMGKNYAIVSKDDYLIYIFNAEHRLISRHNILLGKLPGDKPPVLKENGGSEFRTPGGLYSINVNPTKQPDEYAGAGDYYQLDSVKGSENYRNFSDFSIGIHPYPSDSRREKLESNDKSVKRASNGCINTLTQGSIYDNLSTGSRVYIAYE